MQQTVFVDRGIQDPISANFSAKTLGSTPRVSSIDQSPQETNSSPPPPSDSSSKPPEEKKSESDIHEEKLDKLVTQSNRVLFKTQNVFPLDLFRDEIAIDDNKVSIVFREFFKSGRVHSIHIHEISDVFVEAGPLFATLKIIDRGFVENVIDIKHLWKNDALKARRIIQGLMVAEKEGVDVTKIESNNIVHKLEELGSTNT